MKKILISGLLLAAIFVQSCKKESVDNNDDDTNPPQFNDNCVLEKITRANFDDHLIEYDAQKRLSKVKKGNSIRNFSYNGNIVKVEISDDNGQTIYLTRTITLNNHGLATNVRNDFTAGHWENTAYEYEGTQVVKRIYTHFIATNPSVTTFEWENGNMVREISPGGTITTYAYDTNEFFQETDYFGSGYYDFGIRTIKPKNRVKQSVTQSATYDITHFENANGRVTGYKVNLTPGSDYTVNMILDCD